MTARPILFIEHDADDPPGTLQDWLADAGVPTEVCRPYLGDEIPADLSPYAGIIVLGGVQAAYSDKGFEWRGRTLEMIQKAAATEVPTLGICLGAQLVAQAMGGVVERGSEGMEIGPMLSGRKDVSYSDELFAELPMAPDVIQFHGDVITELPPGAVHLMGGPLYDNQAFRIGERMWATQFHFETTPEMFAVWVNKSPDGLRRRGFDPDLLLQRSEAVHPELAEVWAPFIRRFAEIAGRERPA